MSRKSWLVADLQEADNPAQGKIMIAQIDSPAIARVSFFFPLIKGVVDPDLL